MRRLYALRRAVPLAGLVAGLIAPATAAASPERFPVGGPSMAAAWDVSARHWGAIPCSGKVDIAWTRLERGVNATASWFNPTDAWNNAGANFNCRIAFNVDMSFDWPKFCTVMAHETGHLLGRQHADDLLMGELYTGPLPVCEQTPDPAAPPPPPPADEPEGEPAAAASTSDVRRASRDRWARRSGKLVARRLASPRCTLNRRRAGRGGRAGRRFRRFQCVRVTHAPRRAPSGWTSR